MRLLSRFLRPLSGPSLVDRGRCVGAIFALAASENRDGTERDLSAGFLSGLRSREIQAAEPSADVPLRLVTLHARSHRMNRAEPPPPNNGGGTKQHSRIGRLA